jgi:DNA-directed RNA polymerase specialized sigma24 family protein
MKKALKAKNFEPELDLYFYRRQTHGMVRRYFYTALQTERIGSTLADASCRGWVSSRPIRSFEDALIFVHDMERCIQSLPSLDRDLLNRIVIQEYTHAEAAVLLGMSERTVAYKLPVALDRLTRKLIDAELLILPEAE